jgi:hypothetical protein
MSGVEESDDRSKRPLDVIGERSENSAKADIQKVAKADPGSTAAAHGLGDNRTRNTAFSKAFCA